MQGFTLIEVALILFLIVLIASITLSFSSFNKTFFYLRDVAKNFSVALNTISDLSQTIIEKPAGNFFCAYGIYFPNTKTYEVLAFSTSTNLCEIVFSSQSSVNNFITTNLSQKKYVLQNQQIVTLPISNLSLNTNLTLGSQMSFSTSDKNCLSGILNPPLIIMYGYSYTDLFFLYQIAGDVWQRVNTDYLYICFRKNLEKYTIRINRLGQINFEK